jgi:two-component sensor histidine kinase
MRQLLLLYSFLLLSAFFARAQPYVTAPYPSPGRFEEILAGCKSDTARIRVLLAFGNYYLYRPGPNRSNPDSALYFYNQAARLSTTLQNSEYKNKALTAIATAYIRAGNLARGKAGFLEIVGNYHKTGDKTHEAFTWYALGEAIPISPKEDLPDKIQSFENARTLFKETGHAEEAVNADKHIAEAHLNQDKLDLADSELQQVLESYKAIGYKKLHYTYDLLAEVSKLKVDLHKELLYRIEAIHAMESTGDTEMADYYYSRLALVYGDLEEYGLSVTWIEKALNWLKRKQRYEDYYGDLSLLIYDLIKLNRPREALSFLQKTRNEVPPSNLAQHVDLNEMFGNCYAALKSYDKAEQYYMEMMRDYRITNFNTNFYTTNAQMVTDYVHYYQVLATFYLSLKQYAKAGPYVSKVLELPSGTVRPVTLYKFHEMQFEVDSAAGNYISAIQHFQLHKKLNDSLFNVTKSQQIADLQIKNQTIEKEQTLKLLETQARKDHAELQNVSLQRNITIGGVAMLLIIAGLAYNGYRNKQRSNQTLQIKQTEINQQNQSLQSLLQEKEWLLREVHHRVKNNLQIIISLLNAQSDFLDNPSAIHAIRESRERMQAIALIHQKLYQPDHGPKINMHSYIQDLVSYLESSFTSAKGIYFQLDIDAINLDVSQAVPLGLILNEAITNAVKYAFPGGRRGTISITLLRQNARNILLKITDNGVGLSDSFDFHTNSSLGMQLIRLFAEQLEGTLDFSGKEGVEITLVFKQEFAVSHQHVLA